MTIENNTEKNGPRTNVPELSVSELAFSLKKTLEDSFGRVRVRGELSRVTIPGSGHMYADIKDENAVLNTVCWKGTLGKLSVKPEEGLEVICTGRITTYPARSNYQLIIESMELAGEGALLKMLEERKKKLAAEGLFAPERKKKTPYLPQRIGVITSPTGAVIRDIMHRLNDRFPRHVLLWPVLVQGDGAARQVAAAIRGFNTLAGDYRPDLLIVARGGGSLEDLMPFNEEEVVRAAVESEIPIISAIGHETDTTLLDYAADMRAPTPTGAAEMAVPRRMDLLAAVREFEQRLTGTLDRYFQSRAERLQAMSSRLGDPAKLLEIKTQTLDHLIHKTENAFERVLTRKRNLVAERAAMLRHPRYIVTEKAKALDYAAQNLSRMRKHMLTESQKRLGEAARMLDALSYANVLKRGYVVVRGENDRPVTSSADARRHKNIQLEYADGRVDALVNTGGAKPKAPKTKKPVKKQAGGKDQGRLF